ncbi:hypothetical protein CKA32_005759 [Geitlerinema sp. FC II]|nr:hypothetical protein CKA32_005759 [Geitlerinema sp. FC II]
MQQPPPGIEQGFGIAVLSVDGAAEMVFGNRKPRFFSGGKPSVFLPRIPRHGRARPVSTRYFGVQCLTKGIANFVLGNVFGNFSFGQSQLVPLIETKRSGQRQQQRRHHVIELFGVGLSFNGRFRPLRSQASVIVVSDDPTLSAFRKVNLNAFENATHHLRCHRFVLQQGAVVHQMEAIVSLDVLTREVDGIFAQRHLA